MWLLIPKNHEVGKDRNVQCHIFHGVGPPPCGQCTKLQLVSYTQDALPFAAPVCKIISRQFFFKPYLIKEANYNISITPFLHKSDFR